MTLSSFLNPSYGYDSPPISDRDHLHYSTPWKGSGSKGKVSQSAISALTLLAFLFFLNILQTCLKEQLQAQSPLTIMMTTQTTTTTTEAQRHKRFIEEELGINEKGDTNIRDSEQERNISNNKNFKITETDDYEFGVWKETQKKDKTKKNQLFKSKNLLSDLGVGEPYYSPWLHSVICCKIFSCKQSSEDQTAYQYSNYFRRLISSMCHSLKKTMKNSCTYCPVTQIDPSD